MRYHRHAALRQSRHPSSPIPRCALRRLSGALNAKKWLDYGPHCCFLLTGPCQTRNSGIGMIESDSRHASVACGSGHTTREGRSMDRSLVQAKLSRSCIATRCGIGKGTMKNATRGFLCGAGEYRLPARVRPCCSRLRRAGTGKPRSGLDRMSSPRGWRIPGASRSPTYCGSVRSCADRLTALLSTFSTNATTSNAVKRSSYR